MEAIIRLSIRTWHDLCKTFGAYASFGVSLSDLDGDGDLDGFVANNSANRVWLNDDDTDSDEVADSIDNCSAISNPGQGNLDGDAHGDVCDPDMDGDMLLNGTTEGGPDTDDENDGVLNGSDTDPLDPDGDGIVDGIDPDSGTPSNSGFCQNSEGLPNDTVLFTQMINTVDTCAATEMITLQPSARDESAGHLTLIAPRVAFDPDDMTIFIELGGNLTIITADPTPQPAKP